MSFVIHEAERVKRLAVEGGWIGVDLDGTTFTFDSWVGWNVFGEPIQPMIERILFWRANGVEVRIVTARVGLPTSTELLSGRPVHSNVMRHKCKISGDRYSDQMMVKAIQDHCELHGLPRLWVQPHKDYNMIELWDDRAIQVVANTGLTLAETHAAELAALRGKQFQGG